MKDYLVTVGENEENKKLGFNLFEIRRWQPLKEVKFLRIRRNLCDFR